MEEAPVKSLDATVLGDHEGRRVLQDGVYELSFPDTWDGQSEFGNYRIEVLSMALRPNPTRNESRHIGGIQVYSSVMDPDPERLQGIMEPSLRSEFFCRHCHDLLLEPLITTQAPRRVCRRCGIPENKEPLQIIRFHVSRTALATKLYELFCILGRNADITILRYTRPKPGRNVRLPLYEEMMGKLRATAEHALYSCGRLHRDLSTGADPIRVIGAFLGA